MKIAQLIMESNIEDNQSLERHMNFTINFDIICPRNKCEDIKANGFDVISGKSVQKYKTCLCNFYAHTSWFIVQLANIVIEEIIVKLFSGSIPSKYIAEHYNLSASVISKLTNKYQDFVSQVISIRNKKLLELKKTSLPMFLNDVVWIDETFF